LLANGTPPWLVAAATTGTVVLGVALHQAVLVAGIAVLRWRASEPGSEPEIGEWHGSDAAFTFADDSPVRD